MNDNTTTIPDVLEVLEEAFKEYPKADRVEATNWIKLWDFAYSMNKNYSLNSWDACKTYRWSDDTHLAILYVYNRMMDLRYKPKGPPWVAASPYRR